MSKIALTPNATGTGVFTISSPATNTNRTLTLPDEAGTVLTSASSLASDNLTGTVTVSNGNVGIGTTSPKNPNGYNTTNFGFLTLQATSGDVDRGSILELVGTGGGSPNYWLGRIGFFSTGNAKEHASITSYTDSGGANSGSLIFATNTTANSTAATEAMRIDSSGNVLVGKTTDAFGTSGIALRGTVADFTRDGGPSINVNRLTSDGSSIVFHKAGANVGSIGTSGGYLTIGTGGAGLIFIDSSRISPWNVSTNSSTDNFINLGEAYGRFAVIYAATGSINTSDRNEKQDIDVMSEAETRVAVACKGLMRKFRWKDAVAEKGDDARIHFGIIAQDLQDAFAAEGLDASRYAMFCSDTWWETQTDVSAVEAVAEVLDEEGNVVTEAVEAKEAYIRTDHYDTLEEAPEGATERTRLGVRYSELLAFIIGAL